MFCFLSTHSPTPTKSYVRTWTPEPFIFATIVHGTQQGRNQITIHISRFNLEDHKLASSLSFFFLPFLLCQPFHLHFSLTFPLLLSHTGHQKSPRKRSYVYIVHIHVYRVTNLINEKRSIKVLCSDCKVPYSTAPVSLVYVELDTWRLTSNAWGFFIYVFIFKGSH